MTKTKYSILLIILLLNLSNNIFAVDLDPGDGGGGATQYVDVTITFKSILNFIDGDPDSAGDFQLRIKYNLHTYQTGIAKNSYEDTDPPLFQSLCNDAWNGYWSMTFSNIDISSKDAEFYLIVRDQDLVEGVIPLYDKIIKCKLIIKQQIGISKILSYSSIYANYNFNPDPYPGTDESAYVDDFYIKYYWDSGPTAREENVMGDYMHILGNGLKISLSLNYHL